MPATNAADKLSDYTCEMLKEISLDGNGQLQTSKTLVGYEVVTNGKNFGTTGYYGRAIAKIDDAIEELEKKV